MFQKFYTDTLGGRYIKSLLAQTPIPVFDSVVDGDHLVSGCYYVYKNYIIKCNTSGVLAVSETETLYPSDNLYPSVMLFPGVGIRAATFYVKSLVTQYLPKIHSTYESKSNYYDSETHFYLGKYLRFLLTTTGLNLFPYYNCYNSTYLKDVELRQDKEYISVNRVTVQKYKVIAIPILFGHTYSVAIDCPTQVLLRAAIYDKIGYIEEEKLPEDLIVGLKNSSMRKARLKFNDPIKFRIEMDSIESMMLEKDLYLVIQLPLSNDSSIVVLENYEDGTGIKCDENSVRKYTGVFNSSLLHMNCKNSYAFSDRLIEYLCNHVIHKDDPIVQNIAKAQTLVGNTNQAYKQMFIKQLYQKGVWDEELSKQIYCTAEEYSKTHNIYDQDGNLNKDIVSALYTRGGI